MPVQQRIRNQDSGRCSRALFKAWRTLTTRECLSRARINEKIASEQARDLELCQDTIRELRGKLAAMTDQVKVLVDENSRLKMGESEEHPVSADSAGYASNPPGDEAATESATAGDAAADDVAVSGASASSSVTIGKVEEGRRGNV